MNKNLTIITTHSNADFDAVASMLAAQKIYPDSLVVFPCSQEKNLRTFFINSMRYLFNMVDLHDIDQTRVTKLVIVDTNQKKRIGKIADLLKKPDIDVHIYDHHPLNNKDITANFEINEPVGATVSLLCEIIKKKNIEITPDEATIMCVGIYEDTGSFTFSSTTEKDFNAAAFLLSKGANLNTVSNLIAKEMSPEQISILNDMIQASTHSKVNSIDIVFTSVSTEYYIYDFAMLVHKMAKMEDLETIFALARMGNKISVTARSRIPEVDVGSILAELGGGGHPYAASANINNLTLAQVEQKLLEIIYKKVKSSKFAYDLMSAPAISTSPDTTCCEAGKLMTRYGINALLISETKKTPPKAIGFITRQVIERALYHKLDQVLVKEYMTSDMKSVDINATLPEIQEKIIDNKQRILPVIKKGEVCGVITRTDLLNTLVHSSKLNIGRFPEPLTTPVHVKQKDIVQFINERLSIQIINLLKTIGKVGSEFGFGVYVVGGFVRDLLLYQKNDDIDIVIEGDGIKFALEYARQTGATVHKYEKFGTAVITMPDNFKIDVASARMEYYKSPAALPTVEMSSIKLDLYRRDFTINTLAINLLPDEFGTLTDFFAGQRDLKDKVIRIIHNLSFVEDPTRIFRAIRFEQRFGFKIGKLTAGLIKNAVKMDFFKRLSGLRVFTELRYILEEKHPVPAIIRLSDYNLLQVIHPKVKLDKEIISMLNSVEKVISWHDLLFLNELYKIWSVYFMVLIKRCNTNVSNEISERLKFPPHYRELIAKKRFKADSCVYFLENNSVIKNSDIYTCLCEFPTELILYMMATTKKKDVKKTISYYYTQLKNTKISVKGRDIMKLGIKAGPKYKKILKAVLDAKLDCSIKTVQDELEMLKSFV